MSSTTPTRKRYTTLRIIRIMTNIIIPVIVAVLFTAYNICIYIYTFRYQAPVPKSAVIANVTLILIFLCIARVTNQIIGSSEDLNNSGLGDGAVETGRVEDVAGRIWEHLEPHLTEMREPDHGPNQPHLPWMSREDQRSHRANMDSPVSPPWPPRSNFIITNPDNDTTSPAKAEAQGSASRGAQTERDLPSKPKRVLGHPVVPVKEYLPFRPPRSRTPSPPQHPDPGSTHARQFSAWSGSYVPEQDTRSPYFNGYHGPLAADPATPSRYQETSRLPNGQHPDSQYPSRVAKSFTDIVPPDQLPDHHDEENHDVQVLFASLPHQRLIDYPPRAEKQHYPWQEPEYHKDHLDDKAYQQAKFEKLMRRRHKSHDWRENEFAPGVREVLTAEYGKSKKHRISDGMSGSSSNGEDKGWDLVRRWEMADKYSASRNRGVRSPSPPRGRTRERAIRKSSGSSAYRGRRSNQRRVNSRFPAHWNFEPDRTMTTARPPVESAGQPEWAPNRRQGLGQNTVDYAKNDPDDRLKVVEVGPRTHVPGADGKAQKDRRTADFDTFVKRCLSM